MNVEGLKEILGVLDQCPGYLRTPTSEQEKLVVDAFDELADWFVHSGESQLEWPQEFRESLTAHRRDDERVRETLNDPKNRWLIMAEMRDYAKMKKWL